MRPDNLTKKSPLHKSAGMAYRVGVEFVSGVFVGVIMGYAFDQFFNSRPWGMVSFIILGAASGFLTIYKLMMKENNDTNSEKQNHD